MARPWSAATAATVRRRWRSSVRASAMFWCGDEITSICGCRNSVELRPSVAALAAAKNFLGTSSTTDFVRASTRKYSSSMPNANAPGMAQTCVCDRKEGTKSIGTTELVAAALDANSNRKPEGKGGQITCPQTPQFHRKNLLLCQ